MSQLGFTFYPKDWWTSDSFYTLNPFERYIYLELLFMMYDNEGSIKNDRVKVERRLCTTIKEDVWSKITDLMVEDGGQLTHNSVNKRLKKAIVNRENGKKGGRPKKEEEKPKKPNLETQEKTQENPPYKREREREREIKSEKENKENSTNVEQKKNDPSKKTAAARAATLKRKEELYTSLVPYVERYGKEMIRAFFDYWSEMNKSETKMRFEKQPTWEVAKRLATWANKENFNGKSVGILKQTGGANAAEQRKESVRNLSKLAEQILQSHSGEEF